MKSLRFILPITALATAAITIAQNEGKDPFAVPADVADKIKAALPASTPAPVKKKHEVLVFTKTTTFRHKSIPVAVECLRQLGAKSGLFTVTHSENPASFEPDSLKKFDAVIFANSTGTPLADKSGDERKGLTPEQNKEIDASEARRQEALVAFVKGGKGLVGIHSGGDTYNDWDAYAEMLGTGFMEHPWNSGDTVRVKNLDPQHPLNASFKGEGLTIKDEIYKFKPGRAQPKDRRMLLSLDANGTDLLKDDKDKDGKADREFYPIAWINSYGQGRAFYCSLGHNDEVYWNPAVVEHYLAGIQYALGELPADAAPKPVALVIKDGKLVAAK